MRVLYYAIILFAIGFAVKTFFYAGDILPAKYDKIATEPAPKTKKFDYFDTKGSATEQSYFSSASSEGPALKEAGLYEDYVPNKLSWADKGKKVVLFFIARWCPSCVTADKNFIKKADEIPVDVVILKVDFDTEEELKKKYGVNYQHTFIQVDAHGNEVQRWSGGSVRTLRAYVE